MALGQPLDFAQLHSRWVSWWLTDSGGTLYLAPALILWLGMETECESRARQRHAVLSRHNLAVWGWIALISVVLFLTPPFQGTTIRWSFPFLLVVPLSWIALRMSLRSAYSLITLVAIVSTAGTVAGVGPFQNQGLANPLQLVGTLVVLLAMNVLTIVALVSELNESQSAIRVKSMFLANTSHELRTPLNAIIGFSSMMETEALGPMGNNAYRDYARLIHTSGEHLLAVINGLLDMSKIEAGHFELKEEKFRLGSVVEEAMELIGVQARRKGIVLSATNTESDLTIFADPNAMRQIMLNLLSNAVKFTPDQGRIAVETARGAHAEVVIRVVDSGIGIPDEALERVFQPFERLQKGKDSKAEGTGLGLSITRGLVQLHGGTVALARGKDGGTIATVTLPASRAAGAGATAGTWRETLPAASAAVR
jgi:signal transduction histidine kinase